MLVCNRYIRTFSISRVTVFQNSPEVDDEGYSIRPDEESEEGHILSFISGSVL